MQTPLLPRQIEYLLQTLMQTGMETIFYILYLLINKINSYLLTRAINVTCKNSNS